MKRAGNVLGCAIAVVVSSVLARPTEAALTFNISTTGNAQADAGFAAAGAMWSSIFSDNITVNITAGFSSLGASILGQTSTPQVGVSLSTAKLALSFDSKSASDAIAVANLPAGTSVGFVANNRDGTFFIDNNGSANNTSLALNRANAKALGFTLADPTLSDARIIFSSDFTFDFDRGNGISAGQIDFVGVAAHEIGHALGFTSASDFYDQFSVPNGPNRNTDLNGATSGIGDLQGFSILSVLDLYRYTTQTGAGLRDVAYGGTPYTSIDGGLTSIGLMSSGAFNGDGRQASHWKDNLGIGIMDPTFSNGELGVITPGDVRAFDVIGYDVIPEPGTILLAAIGSVALLQRRRRPAA